MKEIIGYLKRTYAPRVILVYGSHADGLGAALQSQVRAYLKNLPQKSAGELQAEVAWCKKMLLRTRRGDAEGMFRWHWLLTESLEIYCDLLRQPYRGPKKSLRWMEQAHPDAFLRYTDALNRFSPDALDAWIGCLEWQAADG